MSYVLPMIVQLLRHRAQLTQAALATEVGVSASAVTQAENADNAMQERIFANYARALGLDEAEALEEGLRLYRRVQEGEPLAEMFPHLARKESDAPAPPKPTKPSKVHRRPPVTIAKKKAAPPARGKPSKIAAPRGKAKPIKPAAKAGAKRGARARA